MKQIGVGLVSYGWMGRVHSRAYRAVSDHFPELGLQARLVVVADPVEDNRRAAVEGMGFERSVGDYREVLADPRVDVVSICSPNYLHREVAVAAAAAGKPFWVEKPMGVSSAESAEITMAAAKSGVVTAVGFNYRHAPAIAHARHLVRSGRLGRITNVRVWLIADYASDPEGPLTWRHDRERAGAGVVGDIMSHGIDLAQFLVGRIAEVTAMTRTFIEDRPIPTKIGVGHAGFEVGTERGAVGNEDYVGILARFEDGTVGTLEASRVSVGPRAEYVVEIYGTGGSVRWNFERMNQLEVCMGDGGANHGYTTVLAGPAHGAFAKFQPGAGQPMGYDDLKAIEAKLFLESVLTGRQLAPAAADGWSAAAVDEAVVTSAAHGGWHSVPVIDGTTYDA